MLKPLLKISHRTLVLAIEIAAVISILLAFVFGAFMWRVSQGPMHIGWAKDYVEGALSNQGEGLKVTFDDIVFSWPDMRGPFSLDLTGLHVAKGEGESNTLTIQEASVGLSRGALLIGLIRPVSVIIKSPSLELVRNSDGHLNLLIQNKELKVDENAAARKAPNEEIALFFKDMALRQNGSMLARLRQFQIRNASVAVRDHKFGLSWYLTDLNFLIQRKKEGVAASLDIPLPGGQKLGAHLAVDVAYRTKTDDFKGIAHIREINPYIVSRFLPVPEVLSGQNLYFTGQIESTMDTNFMPVSAKFGGAIPEGTIEVPEEFDAPIALKNISIESEYRAEDKKLSISRLAGEIGGIAFDGKGEASYTDDSFSIPVTLNVAAVKLEQIPPLFPKSEKDGEAYAWLAHKIQGGSFSNVALDMELAGKKTRNEDLQRDEWDTTMPRMKLGFDFDGAKVQYSDTLSPAEDGSGHGSLDLAAQTLDITGGKAVISGLQGTDVSVKVSELLTKGAGYVTVKTHAKGPMAGALNYIALEPINMGKERIGLDPANVKGMIDADVSVALPTVHDVPKDEVKVDIKGTMSDLDVPDIVAGLPLSGGPLSLETVEGGFTVKGDAKLADQAVKVDWMQYFESAGHPFSMQIKASGAADQNIRNHFGVDLDEYIGGTLPVNAVYTRRGDGTADVDLQGDLAPVRIYINTFKYDKPAGTPGSLSLKAYLKNDTIQKLTGVTLKSKDLSVSDAAIGFAPMNGKKADLASGTVNNAVIGKTKASVTFNVKNNVMNVDVKSPVFDIAPFLEETDPAKLLEQPQQGVKKQPMKITLAADKMLGKNDMTLNATKSYMEMDDDGDITRIEYDANVGKGRIAVRFRPDETGKRTFRLQTNDAGSVLSAFGLYENVVGGTLIIYGKPKEDEKSGNLYGSMRMENFRVVKAPVLASLLNLMSLSGVGQLLNNQGLVFSKLESGFEWRFRPEGNLLIIKDGKTSGSSIGLTFSGVIDRGKKTTDVAGTIIPITSVNTLLSKVPLIGDILGGASGLIAATYSMKGPSSNPQVSVNPLSVLAPGIIRRILFEGGYESKIPEDDERPAGDKDAKQAPAKTSAATPAKQPARTVPIKANATNQ